MPIPLPLKLPFSQLRLLSFFLQLALFPLMVLFAFLVLGLIIIWLTCVLDRFRGADGVLLPEFAPFARLYKATTGLFVIVVNVVIHLICLDFALWSTICQTRGANLLIRRVLLISSGRKVTRLHDLLRSRTLLSILLLVFLLTFSTLVGILTLILFLIVHLILLLICFIVLISLCLLGLLSGVKLATRGLEDFLWFSTTWTFIASSFTSLAATTGARGRTVRGRTWAWWVRVRFTRWRDIAWVFSTSRD